MEPSRHDAYRQAVLPTRNAANYAGRPDYPLALRERLTGFVVAKFGENPRVCDVGCGNGRSIKIWKPGPNIVGVDIEAKMLAEAISALGASKCKP